MFLHAGNNKNILLKEIIGIFDMDTATVSPDTREFLKSSDKARFYRNYRQRASEIFYFDGIR